MSDQHPKVSLELPEDAKSRGSSRSPTPTPTSKRKTFFSNILPQTSTASATGNPRNKCALKPGHSLMDWIRLGSSGVDLAGTKGVVTAVTLAELSKHNRRGDAWLAIRGNVYNVTRYMDFHPGGADELLKGVGIDATKMFDEVHAWVNYEQLLGKCFVGPLRAASTSRIISSSSSSQLSSNSGLTGNGFRLPFSISASNFISSPSPDTVSMAVKPSEEPTMSTSATDPPETIPRFDWIQKSLDLVVVFYTRSLCNPGLIIEYLGDELVDVKVLVNDATYLFKFTFAESVKWPCSVRNVIETGKIEITFTKQVPALWASYGVMEMNKAVNVEANEYEYDVSASWPLTHDSYALILKPVGKVLILPPIGYHISIKCRIKGQDVTRSYTPVPHSCLTNPCPNNGIAILVKSYENGSLSRYLCQSNILQRALRISPPRGTLSMMEMRKHARIALFAAGSGVTPFLGIIEYLLNNSSQNQCDFLVLHYFNKTEGDIWCRSYLDMKVRKENKFQLKYYLSDESGGNDTWTGERGRVSRDLIVALSNPFSNDHATFIGICGPPAFNYQILEFIAAVGLPSSTKYHLFEG